MVNISEVARYAGVSTGAVSRVLSRDPSLRVSAETRERILAAARELNYVPSHAARSLRTARAGAVALILPEITSTIVAELTRSVEDAAGERGVNLLFARTARLEQDRQWLHVMLASGRVDGVLLQLPEGVEAEHIFEVAPNAASVVLINSVDSGPLSTVVLDDALSIRPAVEHLVQLGHRRIGFIGGLPTLANSARRQAGFLAAMTEFGLPIDSDLIMNYGFSGTQGRQAIAELFVRDPLPTALVVANVDAALGVLAELHERGVRVPADVSIVALHDVWYADATWPPMTTVKAPMAQLGQEAVSLLLDRSDGRGTEHRVVSEPAFQLIARASTAPLAVN